MNIVHMRILLSNDDGIRMAGLECLERTVRVRDVDEQNHKGNLITEKFRMGWCS